MNVYSIFDSIDGEVNFFGQGRVTTFIRLAGCSLHCKYCDTEPARNPENSFEMTPQAIAADVIRRKPYKVTITGGEPLEQADGLKVLLDLLREERIFSSIETNGSIPIPRGWPCTWVADYKLKGSGMQKRMSLRNFDGINPDGFIKFVCTDRADYEEAKVVMGKLRERRCWARFALSPTMPGLAASDLISWAIADGLTSVIINIQIHKLLDLTEDRKDQPKIKNG